MSYEIEVKGLDALQKRFNMSNKHVEREARAAMTKAAATVHDRAGTYPPQRPTTYVRTGNLGRSFTHRVESGGGFVRGYVANSVPYAPYVRGDGTQAAVHAGHWATMRKIVQEKTGQIIDFFSEAIDRIVSHLAD